MMTGRPLFLGKNHIDQFCVITQLLGNPPDNVVANITSQSVSELGFPFTVNGLLTAFPSDFEFHQIAP
jgi:hypothetical protein